MHPRPWHQRILNAPTLGGLVLLVMTIACFATLPYALNSADDNTPPRYKHQQTKLHHIAPLSTKDADDKPFTVENENGELVKKTFLMGTDDLGRSMAVRCLLGGAISLGIGFAAALISVSIGTLWGIISGYAGGRVDSGMMRIVDILYSLPYILLVILIAVSADGLVGRYKNSPNQQANTLHQQAAVEASGNPDATLETVPLDQLPQATQQTIAELQATATRRAKRIAPYQGAINLATLFIAIGSVSWLTLARVVRGQVLSIKSQPFIEAARAAGLPTRLILFRHILPNLVGPIIVYTTLTVPQAILQESFLSFLGIGVKAPLPSWGNLASEGLSELNPVKGHWWLLVWPCALLGVTLLSLNFLGDGLRARIDPRTRKA